MREAELWQATGAAGGSPEARLPEESSSNYESIRARWPSRGLCAGDSPKLGTFPSSCKSTELHHRNKNSKRKKKNKTKKKKTSAGI